MDPTNADRDKPEELAKTNASILIPAGAQRVLNKEITEKEFEVSEFHTLIEELKTEIGNFGNEHLNDSASVFEYEILIWRNDGSPPLVFVCGGSFLASSRKLFGTCQDSIDRFHGRYNDEFQLACKAYEEHQSPISVKINLIVTLDSITREVPAVDPSQF